MPFFIWPLATAIFALLGIGGGASAFDQYQKRKQEQAAYRARLQQLEGELKTKEEQLAILRVNLGEKNNQVRTLSAEVINLRNALAAMRMSA
jgi:capsule polysaccharide export protein KpsE/RkpR